MTPVEVWEYADKCGADPECYDTAADHYFQSLKLSEDLLAKGRFSSEVSNHFSEAIQLGNKKTALKILKNQTAAKKYSLIQSGIYQVNSGLATPQSYITLLDFWDTDVLSGNMNRHDLIENWDILHKDQRYKRNMKQSTSDLIGSVERLLRDDEVNEYLPYIFETYSKKFLEQSKNPYWWVSKDREGLMLRDIERRRERYKSNFEGAEPLGNPGWLLNESDAIAICNATEFMLKRLLKQSDVSTIPDIEQSLDAVIQGLENFVVYKHIDGHYDELIKAGFVDVVKASIERRAIRESGFQTRKDLLPYARMDFYRSVLEFPEQFDVEIKELSTLAREILSTQQPTSDFYAPFNPLTSTWPDIEVYKIKQSLRFLNIYFGESKAQPSPTDAELITKWKLASKTLLVTFKKSDDESWDDFLTRIETTSAPKRLSYNMLNMLESHEPKQKAYDPDHSKNQHLINTDLMGRITPHLKRNERPEFLKALALAGDPEGAAKLFIETPNIGNALEALFISDAYAASSNDAKAKQWLLAAVDKCKKFACSSYIYKRIIASGGMNPLYSEDSPLLRVRRRIDKNLYEVLLESDAPDSIEAIERHMEFQLSHNRELDALPLIRLTAAHCGTEKIKPLHREILSRVEMKYSNFELNRAIEALIENDCFELVDLAFEKVSPEFDKKHEIKNVITSMIDIGHFAELPKWFRMQAKGPEIYANFRHTAHRLRLKQANDQWTLSKEKPR